MSHGIHPPMGEPLLHSSPVLDFPTLDLYWMGYNQKSHGFHPLRTGHGSKRFADQMSHGIHPPMGEPPLHSSPVLDFPTPDIYWATTKTAMASLHFGLVMAANGLQTR